jgi:very-short-patch-repair endonuclease
MKDDPASNDQTEVEQTWAGKLPDPALWEKLKQVARQMRQEPTQAERRLWQQLKRKQLGAKFRRQHAIERFIVDFYCAEARLVIEVDGMVHDYTGEHDMIRQEYLESLGLRVLRFTNEDVMKRLEGVLHMIREALGR